MARGLLDDAGVGAGDHQAPDSEVGHRLDEHPGAVGQPVRVPASAGLVERATDPADTRAVRLSVTDRGGQVVTAARATVLNLEEQRLAPLGGPGSRQGAQLRETLLVLLRHTHAMRSARQDEEPAPTSPDSPRP